MSKKKEIEETDQYWNKTWMVIISLTDKQQAGPRRAFVGLVNSV